MNTNYPNWNEFHEFLKKRTEQFNIATLADLWDFFLIREIRVYSIWMNTNYSNLTEFHEFLKTNWTEQFNRNISNSYSGRFVKILLNSWHSCSLKKPLLYDIVQLIVLNPNALGVVIV